MKLSGALLPLGLLTVIAAGCGSDETQAPVDDHTPVSYTVLVNDVAVNVPYTFAAGQTVRVRIKFLNAASEDLDDVETDHFAGLTLDPTSLGAVARVTGHHFQFDVTGGSPGTGTVEVSFGHDELADETTFTPVAVTVQAGP